MQISTFVLDRVGHGPTSQLGAVLDTVRPSVSERHGPAARRQGGQSDFAKAGRGFCFSVTKSLRHGIRRRVA